MSLTEVSFYFRKYLPFGLIFFLVFLIFFYVIKLSFSLILPSVDTTVYYNPAFGKISAPQVTGASSSAGLTFTLDTIEGKPLTATSSGYVYFLPPSATRFGYREKLYLIAKTLGFDTEIVKYQLNGKNAVFTDGTQTLTADITDFNFNYEYDYKKDSNIFKNTNIPDESRITNDATNLLKNVGRYPEELAQGKTNIIYFFYDPVGNTYREVERPQEANVVEVDFYRADVPGDPQAIPIVAPSYFNSQNHVIMLYNDNKVKPLKVQVEFFEKSEDQVGIYPLKTGDDAWKDLQEGRGIVLSNPLNTSPITIKRMFLGYLDPDIYQDYLQPIYVFLGEDKFVGIVPALSKEYGVK